MPYGGGSYGSEAGRNRMNPGPGYGSRSTRGSEKVVTTLNPGYELPGETFAEKTLGVLTNPFGLVGGLGAGLYHGSSIDRSLEPSDPSGYRGAGAADRQSLPFDRRMGGQTDRDRVGIGDAFKFNVPMQPEQYTEGMGAQPYGGGLFGSLPAVMGQPYWQGGYGGYEDSQYGGERRPERAYGSGLDISGGAGNLSSRFGL